MFSLFSVESQLPKRIPALDHHILTATVLVGSDGLPGGYYDSEQEAAADELELWRHPNPMPTKEGRDAAETRTPTCG